jgi:pilus assembly protein Flp/PilA
MCKRLADFVRDEDGATAIEYTLLVGLIGITAIGGGAMVGDAILGAFEKIVAKMQALAP